MNAIGTTSTSKSLGVLFCSNVSDNAVHYLSCCINLNSISLMIFICDRILENSNCYTSQMKYAVFHHVFKVISINAYVIPEYFLNVIENF